MKTRRVRIPFLAAAAAAVAYYAALKIADPVAIRFIKPSWFFNFSIVWLAMAAALLIPAFPDSRVARSLSRACFGGRRRKIATAAGATVAGAFAAVSIAMAVWIMTPIGDGSLVREPARGESAAGANASEAHPGDSGEYLVVLGGGILPDGSVSLGLKSRLDAAIAYLARHPAAKAVVTGGKLRDLPRSEGEAMAEYLLAHGGGGAAHESVLSEEDSKDTIQNMANVRDLIRRDASRDAAPDVIILTNEFHLRRSLYLARLAGFEHPRGIAAPSPAVLLPHNLLREVGAWWKLGIRQAMLAARGKKLFAR